MPMERMQLLVPSDPCSPLATALRPSACCQHIPWMPLSHRMLLQLFPVFRGGATELPVSPVPPEQAGDRPVSIYTTTTLYSLLTCHQSLTSESETCSCSTKANHIIHHIQPELDDIHSVIFSPVCLVSDSTCS